MGGDELRFALEPADGGLACVLRLSVALDDRQKAARDGAGWHVCLDRLELKLAAGRATAPGQAPTVQWRALYDEYRRQGFPNRGACARGWLVWLADAMKLGLRQRACVVTGASRGIGAATAVTLAGEGASVLLVGRSEDALTPVAERCAEAGGEAGQPATLALDVTAPDAGPRVLEACLTHFGRVDALVNNAGTSELKALEELTDDDWHQQWELNVMGPMRLMRALAPAMAERGWGRIVNVCSSSGKRPSQTNLAYSVTKAAELSLSRAFADRYADSAVLVNAVTPGPTASELWVGEGGLADQNAAAKGISREDALRAAAEKIPLGRLAEEQEIADVIVFLCSEVVSNVAGAAWSVDGGSVPIII